MANLSQNDRTLIIEHPLDDSLDHLRDILRKVEQSYGSDSTSCSRAVDRADQGLQKAVSRLLYTLQGHEVALNLRSKIGRENIASELSALFRRVQNGNFSYEHYRALSRLVIKKASDVKIWSAVFNLIITLSRISPPASIPLVRRDTYHTFLRLAARRRANSPVSRR